MYKIRQLHLKMILTTMVIAISILLRTTSTNATPMATTASIQWLGKDSVASAQVGFRLNNIAYFSYNRGAGDFRAYDTGIRRFRLNSRGFVVIPELTYYVQAHFSTTSVAMVDALIRYQITPELDIAIGRTKVPANREMLFSSGALAFTERSFHNELLTAGYDFGLIMQYKKTLFADFGIRFKGMFGGETRGTGRGNYAPLWAVRADLLPFGFFGDYSSGAIGSDEVFRASAGAYVSQMHTPYSIVPDDSLSGLYGDFLEQFLYGADVIMKFKGFSLMSEFGIRRFLDEESREVVAITSISTEGGYLFTPSFETMLRYTQGSAGAFGNLESYSLALNYYLFSHRTKFQLEGTYLTGNLNFSGRPPGDYLLRFMWQIQI